MTIKHFRLVVNENEVLVQWLNPENDIWMTECTYRLTKAKFSDRENAKAVRSVWVGIFEKMAYINEVWRPRWSFEIKHIEDTD